MGRGGSGNPGGNPEDNTPDDDDPRDDNSDDDEPEDDDDEEDDNEIYQELPKFDCVHLLVVAVLGKHHCLRLLGNLLCNSFCLCTSLFYNLLPPPQLAAARPARLSILPPKQIRAPDLPDGVTLRMEKTSQIIRGWKVLLTLPPPLVLDFNPCLLGLRAQRMDPHSPQL